MSVHVQLLTRTGCSLCETAYEVVSRVAASRSADVTVTDIDSDPDLRDRWEWDVPVVLVEGRQVGFHRIDPDRLARAIDARAVADA